MSLKQLSLRAVYNELSDEEKKQFIDFVQLDKCSMCHQTCMVRANNSGGSYLWPYIIIFIIVMVVLWLWKP